MSEIIAVNTKQDFRDFPPFIFSLPLSSPQVCTWHSCFSPGEEPVSLVDRNDDLLAFCFKHPSNPASVSPGVLIFLLTAKTNYSPRAVCSCLLKVSVTFLEDDLFFKHTMSFLSTATYHSEGRNRFALRKPNGVNHPPSLLSALGFVSFPDVASCNFFPILGLSCTDKAIFHWGVPAPRKYILIFIFFPNSPWNLPFVPKHHNPSS